MVQNFWRYNLVHLYNIAINLPIFSNNYRYVQLNRTSVPQHLNLFHDLNLDGWFRVLCNKLIILWNSIIIILYQSQIINNFWYFFLRYISFFSYISLSVSFVTVSEVFCWEVFETFAIILTVLIPIKSPVASAVLRIAFFGAV